MSGFLARVRDLLHLVLSGRMRRMWRALTSRFYSDSASLGLRRDLAIAFPEPPAKRPVQVRPLAPSDELSWLDVHEPGLSGDQVYARLGQLRLLHAAIATCHVALDPDGQPCYMQWLIPAKENDRVRAFFGNLYPHLAPDEALLEGAYTPEAYRGQGIMACAIAQIAARARPDGRERRPEQAGSQQAQEQAGAMLQIEDQPPAIGQRVCPVAPAQGVEREAVRAVLPPRGGGERVAWGDGRQRTAGAQFRPVGPPICAVRAKPEGEVTAINGKQDHPFAALVGDREDRRHPPRRRATAHGDDPEHRAGGERGVGRVQVRPCG